MSVRRTLGLLFFNDTATTEIYTILHTLSLHDALRRFKRSVTKAGTLQEARKREHYEKPSVKRKRKSEAARKRKKY